MSSRIARVVAVALFVILGLARGAGGVAYLVAGPALIPDATVSPFEATVLGLGLIAVTVLCLLAGFGLWIRHPRAVRTSHVALLVFVVGGAVNGTIMYGAPRLAGLFANIAVAAAIAIAVNLSHRERTPTRS